MTRELAWMGFLATLLLAVVMGINVLRESDAQAEAEIEQRLEAVRAGIDLYALNCAVCHGAAGEGLGATPPLAGTALDAATIYKTIERGRYNTTMAAYGADEGGIFTAAQLDSLVTTIQYANWGTLAARVDALGLTPPDMVAVELTDDVLASVEALPDGVSLVAGLTVYAAECAACHGANAEGTTLAPALAAPDLSNAEISRVIANGVPGTLMAAWDGALSADDIANLTLLLRRWGEIAGAGIEIPVVEVEPIEVTPELIAQGEWLYRLTCAQCHGVDGFGTRLAPALNSQQFLSDTPDAAIEQIIARGVSGTRMPAWSGRLSEQDIDALVAYLRSWEPTAPAIAAP